MHEIFLWLSSSFKALHSTIVCPLKKMPEEVEIFLSPQVAFVCFTSTYWCLLSGSPKPE